MIPRLWWTGEMLKCSMCLMQSSLLIIQYFKGIWKKNYFGTPYFLAYKPSFFCYHQLLSKTLSTVKCKKCEHAQPRWPKPHAWLIVDHSCMSEPWKDHSSLAQVSCLVDWWTITSCSYFRRLRFGVFL